MSIFSNFFHVKQSPILSMLGFGGGGTGTALGGAAGEKFITIEMWGAGGGSGDNGPHNQQRNYGAPGGSITIAQTPYDSIGLSPGNTLYLYVGGGGVGQPGPSAGGPNGGHPGRGGNGAPGADSAGGGGMTSIYLNNPYSNGESNLFLIAAGGGGSAAGTGLAAGGYPQGVGGGPPSHYPGTFTPRPSVAPWLSIQPVGGGGSQTTSTGGYPTSGFGGAPGGSAGSKFTGGDGPDSGGGGAGYYGGGSGRGDAGTVSGSGGGGGSNYQNPSYLPGPLVTHHSIFTDPTWSPIFDSPPANGNAGLGALNQSSPNYSAGVGAGGPPSGPGNGGNGYIVITDPSGTSTFSYTGSQQTYTLA
jgi:hypothetical protein